jgi:hypothetical protein
MSGPDQIFSDKQLKGKAKTNALVAALEKGTFSVAILAQYGEQAKEPLKVACLEALEHVSKTNPARVGERAFLFAVESLSSQNPSVKREAGRLIANTAAVHAHCLPKAIAGLKQNAINPGTVVRWSAALALGEILKVGSPLNRTLVPEVKKLMEKEEKESIRKLYHKALKSLS